MSLLRLTFPTSSLDTSLKPTTRRIYRWGDMWGILMNDKWTVERRTVLETDPLLEKVERFPSVHTAPFRVDDVWEEEVYVREDGLEINGLSSICLSGQALKQWCIKQNMPVPSSLEHYKVSEIPTSIHTPSLKKQYPYHSTQKNDHKHAYGTQKPSFKPKPKQSVFMIQD